MQLLQFKALADSTRLRLLHLLYRQEFSVNELVHILAMGQSRISRHLKILTEAGLLKSRRDGLWIFYSAPCEGIEHDFLAALTPFLEVTEDMKNDDKVALRVLDERAAKSRSFFDSIAEKWDDLNQEILGDYDLPSAVCDCVPAQCKTAADLGCGTGTVLIRLADVCPHVIGVDNSHCMLEICSKRFHSAGNTNASISLRIGELTHLPFRDHELDFACVNLVLHHLSNPWEALDEIRRCLGQNGTFVLSDFLQHNDETMRVRYGDLRLGFGEEEILVGLQRSGFHITSKKMQRVLRDLTLFIVSATTNT